MNRKMNIEGKIISFIRYLSIVLLSFLFVITFFLKKLDAENIETDNIIINFISIGIILLCLGLLYISKFYICVVSIFSKYRLIIYLIYFIAGLLFIITADEYPSSDSAKTLNVAYQLLAGDMSSYTDCEGYMFRYPFQNGIVLFNIVLIKLFSSKCYIAYQIINLIFELLFIEYIGRIAGIIWKSKNTVTDITRIFIILFSVYFLNITYNYGNIISLSLIVLAIYFELQYIEQNNYRFIFLSIIFSSLSYVMKNNSVIIMLGMIILLLFNSFKRKKKQKLVIGILLSISFFAGIIAVKNVSNSIMENYIQVETPEGMPKINWIAMGLTGEGNYSGLSVDLYREAGFEYEKSQQLAYEHIIKRLKRFYSDKSYACDWFLNKMLMIWDDSSFDVFTINNRDSYLFDEFYQCLFKGNISRYLSIYLSAYQHFIYLFSLIYFILNKDKDIVRMFFIICIIGGFLFHVFWEGGSHYVLPYFLFMIPYASLGMCSLINVIEKYGIRPTMKSQP